MNEPDNFLTRWSRRKLVAEEPAAPAAAEAAPHQPGEDAASVERRGVPDSKTPLPEPAFDPASLPSIDSIGAQTDISAFLKANVPGSLRLAALRRAWVTDPAIRDFKGLAENDWDFTVPNEAMGFGEMDPGFDTKKMLADVFGDKPSAEAAAEVPSASEPTTPPLSEQSAPPPSIAFKSNDALPRADEAVGDEQFVHRNNDVAAHTDADGPDMSPTKQKRRGGGALPQ